LRLVVAFLLCLPVITFGQVTTAKPDCAAYSVDTGATHYPDHLWTFCEGSGTSLADEGSGTTYNLTITGADWATDGTHGDVLDFVSANSDYAQATVSGLSGAQTICAVVKISTLNTLYTVAALGDATTTDAYAYFGSGSDGDAFAQFRDSGGTESNATNTPIDDGSWNLVCGKFQDSTEYGTSVNGAAWELDSTVSVSTVAALDRFSVGSNETAFTNNYLNGEIAALWWYESDKSSAEISAIYNSGDPWSVIGFAASDSVIYRRRDR
jgi:hypothetical protein